MGKNMKYFFVYWLPPVVWMVFIFPSNNTLTSDSTSHIIVPVIRWLLPLADQQTVDLLHKLIRKTFHFLNYGFLTFLLFRAFRGRDKRWELKWVVYACLVAIWYGSVDEFAQTMMPSRTGSIFDWMIDSAGSVFALCTLYLRKEWLNLALRKSEIAR